jgi:hypothetical protein
MTTIEIFGGDLAKGTWQANGHIDSATMNGPDGIEINLTEELKSIQELTEHNQASLKRIAVSAAVGALLAGPFAALGGALLFGRRKSMSFIAELTDGRQFVGIIDKDRYPNLVAIAVQNRNR